MTPNPYPLVVPTLLVIPRFSCCRRCCCCYYFSFLIFFFCLMPRYVPTLPYPPLLLHLFLDRLTASPRLALHHMRQRPPGQPAHAPLKPASLECAVRHMGSGIRNLSYYFAPPMTWASL